MSDADKSREELIGELEELRRVSHQRDSAVRQQERLRALAQMARGVVHDFNNSLTPIMGAADFMLTHEQILESREDTMHMLECIRAAATEAKSMVSRLRAFYRPAENSEVRVVYLNPLILGVLQLLEPLRRTNEERNGIVIQMDTELRDLPAVQASEAQMREVIANILVNAVTAMPHGGRVVITSGVEGDEVAIEIRDTGMGMSEEALERCFEPFFSTKPGNGSGIGLAMAYFVVQNCNGTIQMASEPGVGSVVSIRLPMAEVSGEAPASATQIRPARSLNILLVEKDQQLREVISAYFTSAGHTIEMLAARDNVTDTIASASFDAVLLGERTIGLSLAAATAAGGACTPPAAIVLLQTYEQRTGPETSTPAGVDVALDRSFTCAELLDSVTAAVLEKRA
ncbi:MAG: ATP-binding protein [Verrucomicrobia bacterium]|nr:ATP-binding protein [Verrucomicrobiota bacterium]MDA1086402.1 ATP-binding protein [Verrucomicrobiota bacterium]